jgi:uncharacterized protein (TIGR00369 family)
VIDAARRFAAALAATPYASRVGFAAGDLMSDTVTASVPYVPVLANAQGFVHGGVAASLSVWTAMLAAVASDRDDARVARPVSLHVSYLAAAREEALHATARVTSRGRDIVHVEVEVSSDRGRPVAAALAVLRTRSDELPRAPTGPAPRPVVRSGEERSLVSPFSQSMGLEVRELEPGSATLAMRRDLNEGLGAAIDPGALVAMADTCAALACLPSIDERLSGSATLSLAAVFGSPLRDTPVAVGTPVAEDGGVRSAIVEIGGDGPASRALRHAAMTACVTYRFLAFEPSR